MAEADVSPPSASPAPLETSSSSQEGKPWHSYTAEQLKRTVFESTDSAIRSARSLQENSSMHFRTLQDIIPQLKSQYQAYEHAFFKKCKDELMIAREHPVAVCGAVVATGLLVMRGPRRFLFRHTLGRFQSEEAQFLKAEKNVKELGISVDLVKNESKKLLERATLAQDDMKKGHAKLKNAGTEIQRLANSVYNIESEATDLMDMLRAIPGRDAIKFRAAVASMASLLKQQRTALDKRILKISELGISV